jgi:hypothetical protein
MRPKTGHSAENRRLKTWARFRAAHVE